MKRKYKKNEEAKDNSPPQKRISSRLRQKPPSTLPSQQQIKETDLVEIQPEISPRRPYARSPFKAVKGQGNSFHGWST